MSSAIPCCYYLVVDRSLALCGFIKSKPGGLEMQHFRLSIW